MPPFSITPFRRIMLCTGGGLIISIKINDFQYDSGSDFRNCGIAER